MATKKTTPKTAAEPAPVVDVESTKDESSEAASHDQLRIKDLLDRVAVATDLNKNKVRSIVEATLNELGKALEAGEGVNLPQLGKIRIVNSRTEDQGTIMTLKLRRMTGKAAGEGAEKQTLAEIGEDS